MIIRYPLWRTKCLACEAEAVRPREDCPMATCAMCGSWDVIPVAPATETISPRAGASTPTRG